MKRLRLIVGGVLLVVLGACILYFVHHVRYLTYELEWFNASETKIGSDLPRTDPFGHPKTIVLARTRNGITCYTAYYSEELRQFLNSSKLRTVHVTYRVTYRFGKPIWVQQTDIEHRGILAAPEYMGQSADGECF